MNNVFNSKDVSQLLGKSKQLGQNNRKINGQQAYSSNINYRLKKKEEKEVDEKMEKPERIKDDNTKYHYVMREINRPKQKIPILVKDEEGNVPGSITEKTKIIEKIISRRRSHPST